MEFQDLEKIGKKVEDMVDDAIRSKNFQQLNQSITQAVNKTISQYKASMPAQKLREAKAEKSQVVLYGNATGDYLKHFLQVAGGFVLSGIATIGLFLILLFLLVQEPFSWGAVLFLILMELGGVALISTAVNGFKRIGRFKKYVKVLGNHTYCEFEQLAGAIRKPAKFVKKDTQKMIEKGWFLQGYAEEESTCLITSHETYRHYMEMRRKAEEKEEMKRLEQEKDEQRNPQVREVLKRGNAYIEKIRQSNQAISGEEISEKISKMERLVQQIFQRTEEHPEVIPDLKKLMDYYLPMTVKLLDAYEEMDKQDFEGETIRNSKKEIVDTLDTLNDAFAQLLDSVFQDMAWDISSDISVLQTMLAQEGLKKGEFDL